MQLNKREAAYKHYEKVVAAYTEKHQYVKASNLCRDKMNNLENAQNILASGWRTGREPYNCLRVYFANIDDSKALALAMNKIYAQDITQYNSGDFLRALKAERSRDERAEVVTRSIAYDLISKYAAKDSTLVAELRFFNEKNALITMDIMRYKLTRKSRK